MTILNAPFHISHPHSGDVLKAAKAALKTALNLSPRERIPWRYAHVGKSEWIRTLGTPLRPFFTI